MLDLEAALAAQPRGCRPEKCSQQNVTWRISSVELQRRAQLTKDPCKALLLGKGRRGLDASHRGRLALALDPHAVSDKIREDVGDP